MHNLHAIMEYLASASEALLALPQPQKALALACAAFLAYRAANWLYRRALTLACTSPLPSANMSAGGAGPAGERGFGPTGFGM